MRVDVVLHTAQPKRRERAEHRDRGSEQHAKRQRPALVKGGEDQEHENERYSEHDSWGYALLRFLFLKRQAKIVVAHLVRHGLSKSFLEGVHRLVRAVAWCGRSIDLSRAIFVVTHREFRTGDVLDRGNRIERHRRASRVANIELADVLRVGAVIAFRFDVDLPGAAEAVEVVHEKAAHEGLERLIDGGEIDPLLDDFVAINLNENLGNVRQKCRNQGAELWPFVRCI